MKLSKVDFVHSITGPGKNPQTGTGFMAAGKFGRHDHDITFEGGFVKLVSHADREAGALLVPVHNVASMVPAPTEKQPAKKAEKQPESAA